MNAFATSAIAAAALLAAGVPATTGAHPLAAAGSASKPESDMRSTPAKPGGTGIAVRYRIEGAPEAGKPVQVIVAFSGVPDADAAVAWFALDGGLAWAASPPAPTTLGPKAPSSVTLSVVPQGEGSGYINVFTRRAGVDSVTAIPVRVGEGAPSLRRPGALKTGPDGDNVISIPVP
jgi:hypothetical protein